MCFSRRVLQLWFSHGKKIPAAPDAKIGHFASSESTLIFLKGALRAVIMVHCLRQTQATTRQRIAVYIGMLRRAAASALLVQNARLCAARPPCSSGRPSVPSSSTSNARQGCHSLWLVGQQAGCRVEMSSHRNFWCYFGCFCVLWGPKFSSRGSAPHPAGARAPDPPPRRGSRSRPPPPLSPPSGRN